MNNKLDLKDPKNHIAYYEIIGNNEKIIVHLKSGQTFYYPYSQEQERHILEIIKKQIEYSTTYKEQLKDDRKYHHYFIFLITTGVSIIAIMTILFTIGQVVNMSEMINAGITLFCMYTPFIFYQNYKLVKIRKEIKRIELLEDVMSNNLLKNNNYSKENIFSNTSSKTQASIHKDSLTKNDIMNEIGRLSLEVKNLKDLKKIVENIQYINVLNQDTEKEEKKYLKK